MTYKPTFENEYIRIKKCRHYWLMYNANDFIGDYIDAYGEWAQPELKLLEQFLTIGDTVLDVGAYIGTHTLFFAQQVQPSGSVYSFEPQRLTYQILNGNVALNCYNRVFTHQVALGEKEGSVIVPILNPREYHNFGSLNLENYSFGEQVPVRTIDSLQLSKCDLIKIDVEGFEQKVLKGAQNTIKTFKPVIYLENNSAELSKELIKTIFEMDYKCWWHIYERFTSNNYFGNPVNTLTPPDQVECNMLCFPQDFNTKDYDLSTLKSVIGIDDNWKFARNRNFAEKK